MPRGCGGRPGGPTVAENAQQPEVSEVVTTKSLVALAGVAVVALAGLLVEHNRGEDEPTEAGTATVVRVVDGDTLVVDLDGSQERVRLIGIDTPESVAEDRPVECYGVEASERLKELLPAGTTIRLERDVEPRDRYDRLLAYVYRADDNLLINREQVLDGFAEAKEYPPNTALSSDLAAAQRTARAAGAGLWSACVNA